MILVILLTAIARGKVANEARWNAVKRLNWSLLSTPSHFQLPVLVLLEITFKIVVYMIIYSALLGSKTTFPVKTKKASSKRVKI